MDKQDVFTSLLLSMPDDTFFYIMRNYLGPLQTPFHKPTLIKKLISFLTRTEVLQRIAEIADTVDRKILTAVSMLEEPSIQDIYEIFKDELEFFQLHYAVLNLEERLLLLTSTDGTGLQINPLFHDLAEKKLIDFSLLIGCGNNQVIVENVLLPAAAKPLPADCLSNGFFIPTVLVHLLQRNTAEQTDGQPPKLMSEKFTSISGNPETAEILSSAWNLAISAFNTLGIVEIKKNIPCIASDLDIRSVADISGSPLSQRLLLPGLAALLGLSPTREIMSQLLFFLIFLTAGNLNVIGEKALQRLIIISRIISSEKNSMEFQEILLNPLMEVLVSQQILYPTQYEGYYAVNPGITVFFSKLFPRHPIFAESDNSSPALSQKMLSKPFASLDSDFTIRADPSINTENAFDLLVFLELRKIDILYSFDLTKKSFLRACDMGRSITDFQSACEKASGFQVPPLILRTLQTWRDSYNRVSLLSGIVLKADAAMSRIITSHPDFKQYILETLAEGLFLMDRKSEKVWRSCLSSFGIEYLPKTKYSNVEKPSSSEEPMQQPSVMSFIDDSLETVNNYLSNINLSVIMKADSAYAIPEDTEKNVPGFVEDLLNSLNLKKLSEKDTEDFRARIDKKLILSDEQIKGSRIHATISEARGLDYQGKINLCKDALSKKNELLEIHERDASRREIVTLLQPTSLQYPARQDAVITGKTLPEGIERSYTVRKVFLLRKLHASLFTP
ncbi:MAG: hypothetical protein K9L21_00190 [Spirochaetia bacterium]|nr:hypothetical protein [Spirochaetia bacterium]